MLSRREFFPNVIELNHQARQRYGCCVYLIHDGADWMLVDIGYDDTVDELVDLIRQLDFSLGSCRYLVATHADVDHIQGLARAKKLIPGAQVVGHPLCKKALDENDRILTYAEIPAQEIAIDLPDITIEQTIDEGDQLQVGNLKIDVWSTPGHTPSQLAFRLGPHLLSGDNIYRDGCVGNIDAHHGSNLPSFISSLERIRDADGIDWLLPSHGPAFRHDPKMIQQTIDRLVTYQHMADFGTCAVDWPLLDEWEEELARGVDQTRKSV